MDEEQSVERDYLIAVVRRSQFLREGRSERANWEYDQLHDLLKNRMRKLPDKGEAALKRIAQHEDAQVRMHAASALLAVDEDFAIRILEQIAARKGSGSFTAETILKEWRKGNLREYWA
jgi:hypothetical protein